MLKGQKGDIQTKSNIAHSTQQMYTVEPRLSGLFTYLDTCLRTNSYASTESDSLIWKFSYPDSQSGNRGVRISETPLY